MDCSHETGRPPKARSLPANKRAYYLGALVTRQGIITVVNGYWERLGNHYSCYSRLQKDPRQRQRRGQNVMILMMMMLTLLSSQDTSYSKTNGIYNQLVDKHKQDMCALMHTFCSRASAKISSKVRNESSFRISSFSHTPCTKYMALTFPRSGTMLDHSVQ
jgi:hypothetical protein